MAQEYFVLSNYGVRYFMTDYTDSSSIPASVSPTDELFSIISADIGTFSKENTKYRTLNSNGWEAIATLGNAAEDGTFSCIREGTGGVYAGSPGDTTYQKIKNWFMLATSGAGIATPKCIIELIPRTFTGNVVSVYEGTCYYVVPNSWTPQAKDTESGQLFDFTVSLFGPQSPLTVEYTPASGDTPESWTLTKVTISPTNPPEQAGG